MMRNQFITAILVLLFAVSVLLPVPTVQASPTYDPSPLVDGVESVCALGVPGPIFVLSTDAVPVVAGDDDTTPVVSVVVAASVIGDGRVVALGHDGFLTNEALDLFDNRRFGINVVDWLDKLGKRRVLVTTGHGEWYGGENFNRFKIALEDRGYTVIRFSGTITQAELLDTGVVIVGNAWETVLPSEIDALTNFVAEGGGLLLMGLGWSWKGYHPDLTLDDYPMHKIAEPYGIRWIGGYISDPTNNYNDQPVFHTFYPDIKIMTIYDAFLSIRRITETYPMNLPSILQSDASLRRDYTRAHLVLSIVPIELPESSVLRQEIYDFYKDIISSYPQYFRKDVVYDRYTHSAMAWIRERIYRTLIDLLPLNAERKNDIATTIGLVGLYLDIWSEFSVFLLDNTCLDTEQLSFIYDLLSLIPRELHNLRVISVTDYLGMAPEVPPFSNWDFVLGKDGGVNIFGVDIGVISENGFPDDVPPRYSDVFCLVVVHEVNHVVDAYLHSVSEEFRDRKAELIARAGDGHMNYLRSMFEDGFFVKYPQEFFASVSNQYFSGSFHTLKLALVRFENGYHEPINQFLFFADAYSLGDSQTLFYTIDTEGNIGREAVLLWRDERGYISALSYNGRKYVFTLDENGYVLTIKIGLPTVETTDETGEEKDVFDIPETVYISGSGYSPTTNYDLYLVEDTTWSDGMDIPDRVSGTETSVTTDENGDIPTGTAAWNGPLTPGKYDIVIDVNGNGKYDEGIDVLDDEDIEVTAGLFVIPEYLIGTILALIGCLTALGVFRLSKGKNW